MDGNSKDATIDIVKQYAESYPHIKWVSEPDEGQSDALNKGVAMMAKGGILGILNVDDFYELGVLNRIVEIFKSLPIPSLLVGNCNVWDNDARLRYVNKPSKLKLTDLLLGKTTCPHPMNPSAYFYHESLHELIGPYIREEAAQDLPFILSAVQVAHVTYVDETWGNYRMLDGTITVREEKDGSGALRYTRIMGEYYDHLSAANKIRVQSKKLFYRMRGKLRKPLKQFRNFSRNYCRSGK